MTQAPANQLAAGQVRSGRVVGCLVASVLAFAAGGCGADLETYYGGMTRRYLPTSVNGVDVLAGMLSDAGHEVSTRRMLITSSMDKVQTVVWFPDDRAAPSAEVCQWFNDWLAAGSERTLVYVGRSFDAAPLYWRKMAPLAPKGQQAQYRRRERRAERYSRRPISLEPKELDCEWFKIEPGTPRTIEELSGPWSGGVDAARAEVEMCDRLVPSENGQTSPRKLLTAADATLAWRRTDGDWDGGKIIVVANGSFLLNLPLVNHQNRKLAGKLVQAVGPPGRLVFLESGPGGPPIDPPAGGSALARLFGVWPLNAILLHLAVLGIIFCFARWPIFGRAKVPPVESTSDFGKHVAAVSELLKRTRDRGYAVSKLPVDAEAAKAEAAGAQTSGRLA
jgi:hypothetical protein